MILRSIFGSALAFGLVIGSAAETRSVAAPITRTFEITATDFMPSGAPVDPVKGSYTITFDPSGSNVFVSFSNITLNNLNIQTDGPPAFDYIPSQDLLVVGDDFGGDNPSVFNNTNDYAFSIEQASTAAPVFDGFNYSQVGEADVFAGADGTVVVSPTTTGVPEPPSLVLLGLSLPMLAAIAAAFRKREANPTAAVT